MSQLNTLKCTIVVDERYVKTELSTKLLGALQCTIVANERNVELVDRENIVNEIVWLG